MPAEGIFRVRIKERRHGRNTWGDEGRTGGDSKSRGDPRDGGSRMLEYMASTKTETRACASQRCPKQLTVLHEIVFSPSDLPPSNLSSPETQRSLETGREGYPEGIIRAIVSRVGE
ncbi:hypothetical protein RRG08_043945 [Elysia crispata]|uniref:Uncharacterized protein n=1 Tax=Elysia crispata TaxID=231223 RepID=A0AAE1CQA8_9GAST|nr:hypothetical protein RRG08_043945 [Elysia crispata]